MIYNVFGGTLNLALSICLLNLQSAWMWVWCDVTDDSLMLCMYSHYCQHCQSLHSIYRTCVKSADGQLQVQTPIPWSLSQDSSRVQTVLTNIVNILVIGFVTLGPLRHA